MLLFSLIFFITQNIIHASFTPSTELSISPIPRQSTPSQQTPPLMLPPSLAEEDIKPDQTENPIDPIQTCHKNILERLKTINQLLHPLHCQIDQLEELHKKIISSQEVIEQLTIQIHDFLSKQKQFFTFNKENINPQNDILVDRYKIDTALKFMAIDYRLSKYIETLKQQKTLPDLYQAYWDIYVSLGYIVILHHQSLELLNQAMQQRKIELETQATTPRKHIFYPLGDSPKPKIPQTPLKKRKPSPIESPTNAKRPRKKDSWPSTDV